MSRSTWISSLTFASVLLATSSAVAHVQFSSPTPRRPGTGNNDIKTGPCGCSATACPNGDVRVENKVTVFEAGETITVQFNETVQHSGWFRIAFDDDGQDFPDAPTSGSAPTSAVAPILLDGIMDKTTASYTAEITLPNTPCDNCTLQLVQVMTDRMPYESYYTCADLTLTAPGAGGAGGAAGAAGAGGNGGASSGMGGMPQGGGFQGGMGGTAGASGTGVGGALAGASAGGMGGITGAGSGGIGGAAAGIGATGGLAAAAGSPQTGGQSGAGGPMTAGQAGVPGAGGSTGGTAPATGGTAPAATSEETGGCTIGTTPRPASGVFALAGLAALGALLTRRRRR